LNGVYNQTEKKKEKEKKEKKMEERLREMKFFGHSSHQNPVLTWHPPH